MNTLHIGVDIGGSHITAAHVNMETRTVIGSLRKRQFINSKNEAAKIIAQWADVIRELVTHDEDEVNIGIAMPGPFDYEKGISWIKGLDKYENLYGLNVKELLADQLKIDTRQIRMNNDAACFLLGEMIAGAGRGSSRSIGITLGTGTGSAIYQYGISTDANLGPSPFLDSIADNYLSTRWFVKQYLERTGKTIANVYELALLYETDETVKNIFSDFSVNLVLFLQKFMQYQDPEIIVLGGNISLCAHLFLPRVEAELKRLSVYRPVRKAVLGEDATILGAASLFMDNKTGIRSTATVL
jgi:glucokinase